MKFEVCDPLSFFKCCLCSDKNGLKNSDIWSTGSWSWYVAGRGRAGYELILYNQRDRRPSLLLSAYIRQVLQSNNRKFFRPPQIVTFSLPTMQRKNFFRPPKFQHKKFANIYDDLLPVGLTAQLIVASQRPGFKFHSGLSRHYISSDKKKCKDHTFRTSFQSRFEIHDLFWDHFAEIKITRFFS